MDPTKMSQDDYKKVCDRMVNLTIKAQDKLYMDTYMKVIKMKAAKQGMAKVLAAEMGIWPGSSWHDVLDDFDELEESKGWGKTSAKDTIGLFITLSPEPGTATADEMLASLDKMFGKPKKGINASMWCVEQSGTVEKGNVGYHPHVHALILLNKNDQSGERAKAKAMVVRNLKKYKTKSDAYLDVKAVSEGKLDDKIAYIMGKKTDKSKQPQVDADVIWRSENGYESVYTGYMDK